MKDNYNVWLTFKTDKETSWLLTNIAHAFKKTQPELINDICKNFVKSVLDDIKETQQKDPT